MVDVVADESWTVPPSPSLLTGEEPIRGATASVRDFWAWTLSDLRSNGVRSRLAEYLVARALGAADRPRVEWDSHDVVTATGRRVEVKSGAYLQSWDQRSLSKITFGGLRSRTWSPQTGYAAETSYNADVYVFSLLTATEHASYDALDTDQWTFWVLSTSAVSITGQASIGLARVQTLAGSPTTYDGLARRIEEA